MTVSISAATLDSAYAVVSAKSDPALLPVTAVILAGGPSPHKGATRNLVPLNSEALVRRVVEIVGSVCAHTVVVTDCPEAFVTASFPHDVRLIRDEAAYEGPLGAIATALGEAEDDWVFAVGADAPWLQADIIKYLWNCRKDARIVLPVGERGPEPLLALYHKDCLSVMRQTLDSGRRRIIAITSSLPTSEICLDALHAEDPELRSLINVEAPEEQKPAAKAILERRNASRPTIVTVAGKNGRTDMPVEQSVTVYLNDVEIATTQSSPYGLEEMAVGFLLAEGLMTDRDGLVSVDVDARRGLVYVSHEEGVSEGFAHQKRYITSGCGQGVTFSSVGHTKGLAPITSSVQVKPDDLLSMVYRLAKDAPERKETGGVHGCGFGRDGELVLVREDIGRHNAVDKLLGRAWLDRVSTDDLVLVSTGRVSYEMTVKAAKARIPIIVSRHAITDLAAEIADQLGITAVAYCRGNKMTVLTHPERVCGAIV